jgi:hypothetical protein
MGSINDSDVDVLVERLTPLLEKLVDANAQRWLERLLRYADLLAFGRRKRLGDFEARLYERWGVALDGFELALYLAQRIGVEFNRFHSSCSDVARPKFQALVRLHAHSSLIAGEVLHLLRGGFAMGAHARWRTLHETSVVMMLLSEAPPDTAQRFLDHAIVKSYQDALPFNVHAERIGYQPLSSDEVDGMKRRVDKLKAKYGEDFVGSYGWSKSELQRRNPSRKGNVQFEELEKTANVEFWRPYYRWASHGVHPTAKSIDYVQGVFGIQNVMLAGPSNGGLADPGSGAMRSLCHAGVSLLPVSIEITSQRADLAEPSEYLDQHKPALSLQILVKVLDQIAEIAESRFLEAHKQLVAEEKSICRAERNGKIKPRKPRGLR